MIRRTAPHTQFGETRVVEVVTYTNGVKDEPAKVTWEKTIWIERGEDWYAFLNPDWARGTIRVVERNEWLRSLNEDFKSKTSSDGY